jgi:hypothetical protein
MSDMLDTMEKAEEMSKLNITTWHDAIDVDNAGYADMSTVEKYVWDPKWAPGFLRMAADPDISNKRQEIASKTLAIQSSLKSLLPTSEQSATHQKLLQLYAFFEEYTSLVYPEGSYTSYTEQEASSKASFLRIFSELKIELTAPERVAK